MKITLIRQDSGSGKEALSICEAGTLFNKMTYHDFPISLYLNGLQFPLISYFGNERSLYRKRSFPAEKSGVNS